MIRNLEGYSVTEMEALGSLENSKVFVWSFPRFQIFILKLF